jgi:hypothetical protein
MSALNAFTSLKHFSAGFGAADGVAAAVPTAAGAGWAASSGPTHRRDVPIAMVAMAETLFMGVSPIKIFRTPTDRATNA